MPCLCLCLIMHLLTCLWHQSINQSDLKSVRDLAQIHQTITVTSVLAKVSAMILEARMSAWAEGHYLRADGQAGFRQDHRTTVNVFILHTLITQARKRKHQLYCCFVDFKKAFDSVPPTNCGRSLHQRGLRVTFWNA